MTKQCDDLKGAVEAAEDWLAIAETCEAVGPSGVFRYPPICNSEIAAFRTILAALPQDDEGERLRGALRAAHVELDMALGGLALLPGDFGQMEEAWPISKRGALVWRHYGHARERIEAIHACVRDARAALAAIAGAVSK